MYSRLTFWDIAQLSDFKSLDMDRVDGRRNCGDRGSSSDEPGIRYYSLVVQSDSVGAREIHDEVASHVLAV